MFHMRTIIVLLGYVVLSSSATCPDEKQHVLACEQTIIGLVNAKLEPYGKTFITTNLHNDTESELLDEKTRDVVCSASNAQYVSCMVDNIIACPDLATDDDIASTWIASLIALNRDVLNSVEHVCEFFKETVCSYREIRLNMCYLSIVGDTVTLNQKVDMCVSTKMDKLTCMIEVYKECKPHLNLTSNGIIAANIKDRLVEDKWDTFNSGSELCDCYEAASCYSTLNQEIARIPNTSDTASGPFINSIALSELLSSNVSLVHCTKKGRSQACSNIIPNFNDTSAKICVYTTAVSKMSEIVNTQKFKTNKPCIIKQLTESYQPCIEKERLPTTVNTCRELRKLYKCISDALNGHCNGDYTNTAYGIIMTSFNDVIDCDVTSDTSIIYPNCIVMLVFLIHISLRFSSYVVN